MAFKIYEIGSQKVVKYGIKTILIVSCKSCQKGSKRIVEEIMEIVQQSKYSGPLPTFVNCQKDSQTTVGNGTQVKHVTSICSVVTLKS